MRVIDAESFAFWQSYLVTDPRYASPRLRACNAGKPVTQAEEPMRAGNPAKIRVIVIPEKSAGSQKLIEQISCRSVHTYSASDSICDIRNMAR